MGAVRSPWQGTDGGGLAVGATAASASKSASQPARYFNHTILDGFLPPDLHHRLLRYALDNEPSFLPAKIGNNAYTDGTIDLDFRKSWYCDKGLGELTTEFRQALVDCAPELFRKLGVVAFPVSGYELELAAHRHGSFFRRHIDTATQGARDKRRSDRIITGVYYFHSEPKRFFGGELALSPLGVGEPMLVEPRNNRLVAFASVAPHEVRPVVCTDDSFINARFAVNIWLHRARTPASQSAGR